MIGPRSFIDELGSSGAGGIISFGTKSNERVGYHVISPFEISDTGEKILVNRGWIPYNKPKRESRPDGQVCPEFV